MAILSHASGFDDVTPGEGRAQEELSPQIAADLHRDAVVLKRGELIFVVPALLLGLFGAAVIAFSPRSASSLGYPTGAAFVVVGKWVRDWYRLEMHQP